MTTPTEPPDAGERSTWATPRAHLDALVAAMRRIADHEPAESFPDAAVWYELSGGRDGIPAPEAERGRVSLVAHFCMTAFRDRLLERYCEATGLTPAQAQEREELLTAAAPGSPALIETSRWQDRRADVLAGMASLQAWVNALNALVGFDPETHTFAPEGLTADEAATAQRFVTAKQASGEPLFFGSLLEGTHLEIPGVRAVAEMVKLAAESAAMSADDVADALKALPNVPTLAEWLTAEGFAEHLSPVRVQLAHWALREERERREAAETQQEAAEAKAEQLQRERDDALALRALLVPQAVHNTYRRGRKEKHLNKLQRGTLAAAGQTDADAEAVLSSAVVRQVSAREMAARSVPEIRVMVAALSLLDPDPDTLTKAARETAEVRTSAFFRLAGMEQTKQRHAAMRALGTTSTRRIFFEVLSATGAGKRQLAIEEVPLFQVTPIWELDDREEEGLLGAWAGWRDDLTRNPDAPLPPALARRMPDRLRFAFPSIVRHLGGALVLAPDILRRLERGAKTVRGDGKLNTLDWNLFVELTLTRQSHQLEMFTAPDGAQLHTSRSYVNRRQFLEDYLPALAQHPKRANEQYLKSVEVLQAGGILVGEVQLAQKVSRGVRDIFSPSPSAIPGLASRAEKVVAARQHPPKKTRRKAKRAE